MKPETPRSHSPRMAMRLLLLSLSLAVLSVASAAYNVSYDRTSLIVDGEHKLLLSGSIHYPRATPEMWPDIIAKAKEGGIDVVETYVFWDRHEPSPGNYFFEGRFDLVKFIKVVQKAGLYANLRIGPYACAEWNFGGFPIWLRDVPGVVFRTNNEPFKQRMESFLSYIVNLMKQEKLFASQGGPIILAQVENEYGNVDWAYGADGVQYAAWAAQMAQAQDTGVPWIMCVQRDTPEYILDTCNGMYCDGYRPNAPEKPAMWTESYTGWFTYYGSFIPHRPVEDLAFAVARFFERGGTFHNYYMYFGGTNFGRTSGGPYVATSYDYDAPIDEYGLLNSRKWGHLKDLHAALKLSQHALLSYSPQELKLGPSLEAHLYTEQRTATLLSAQDLNPSECALFVANIHHSADAAVQVSGRTYHIPAWSVSIFPDCKNLALNTAQVKAQATTATMTKSSSVKLWQSYNEPVGVWGDSFKANRLLEQIHTTQDTTDYLWYTTSVSTSEGDILSAASLWLASMRDIVHVFVNGKLQGSQTTSQSVLYAEASLPVELQNGTNNISVLCATIGLQNFGPFIETWNAGLNGTISLRGLPSGNKDLTTSEWTYQLGLKGENLTIYTAKGSQNVNWSSPAALHQPLTWYKGEFHAPAGTDPVALDLDSMGKGQAWINGESIGRFWPAKLAPETGCEPCDYRGPYNQDKCGTGCGKPSQRWYHVPRSWLKAKGNLLVLFEEIGGDPSGIDVVTRSLS